MNPQCTIPGCDAPARSRTATYCPKHYHRWYRHGDPNKTYSSAGITVRKPREYKYVYNPAHPLSGKNGKTYAHRIVYYDYTGGHEPTCAWCGKHLSWSATKGQPNAVQVDHLNGDTKDNRAENLTASCPRCNPDRGTQERYREALKQGFWSSNDTVAHLTTGSRKARRYNLNAAA